MKLELLMENGRPLIVFPDQLERDKTILVYTTTDGHSSASRAYLRRLKKPETAEEIKRCWQLLAFYAGLPG